MTPQEAIQIVSYKLALKKGAAAVEDPILCSETITQALTDKELNQVRPISAKDYLAATKLVKQARLDSAREAGRIFLRSNAEDNNVKTTPSGLQYKVLQLTNQIKPQLSDTVTVHYEGQLIDGTIFDSSLERGKPGTFALKKLIPGWREGLQLMPLGSRFELFIPEDLAYGERGSGDRVPPYAMLRFQVELLGIDS